jgi:hypothetical protein
MRPLALLSLLLAGCLPMQLLDPGAAEGTAMVPVSPFGTPAQPPKPVSANYAPPSGEMALRVDVVRRQVLAANPKLPVKPLVATIGAPHAELFHQGGNLIHITEGLVKQCKNEGQLAALLCLELGKMASEREGLASTKTRAGEAALPLTVPVGNVGQVNAVDPTRMAELAKFESGRRRASKHAPACTMPPDPYELAGTYLENAGYSRRELEAVAPLLEAADKNYLLEKQFKGGPNPPGWTPVAPS